MNNLRRWPQDVARSLTRAQTRAEPRREGGNQKRKSGCFKWTTLVPTRQRSCKSREGNPGRGRGLRPPGAQGRRACAVRPQPQPRGSCCDAHFSQSRCPRLNLAPEEQHSKPGSAEVFASRARRVASLCPQPPLPQTWPAPAGLRARDEPGKEREEQLPRAPQGARLFAGSRSLG